MYKQKLIGNQAEDEACRYLEKQGLRLLVRNYRSLMGEIDLIMKADDQIVFVEVRQRHSDEYGSALESVTQSKMRKIIKTAKHFLQKQGLFYKVSSRFDIVGIKNTPHENELTWIKNAFEATI